MKPIRFPMLLREASASAAASRVTTVLTAALVMAMCAIVLLTTGRTVGLEQQIIASIDSAGTRTIIVRAEPEAGVDSSAISRLAALPGLQWAGAFGPASDVRNAAIPTGPAVTARAAWTTVDTFATISGTQTVVASDEALEILGMPEHIGTVRTASGTILPLTARFDVPDYLAFMDPIAFIPSTDTGPVAIVVAIVEQVSDVTALIPAIHGALMATDPSKVSLDTTTDFARVQAVIAGQLGGYGSTLVLATLTALAAIVASLLWGLVMIRRKDFGRRRALGASQPFIIALVLTQTAIAAVVGALIGTAGGTIALALLGDPQPGLQFTVGVAVLSIAAAVLGALVPAIIASRREPLAELRVP